MDVAAWTPIGSLVIAIIASVFIPLWVIRRNNQRAVAEQRATEQAASAATEVVSWEKINQALARERDALAVALRESAVEHRHAIQDLRDQLAAEAAWLKQRTDSEIDRMRIANDQLNIQINNLYRQLVGSDSTDQ
jgi:hypothetical protein